MRPLLVAWTLTQTALSPQIWSEVFGGKRLSLPLPQADSTMKSMAYFKQGWVKTDLDKKSGPRSIILETNKHWHCLSRECYCEIHCGLWRKAAVEIIFMVLNKYFDLVNLIKQNYLPVGVKTIILFLFKILIFPKQKQDSFSYPIGK